ncbi:MAG: dephospho-CoA kinase [Spirochaetaceae bacterium]|jgi:dephospho-CoA kinase|nr:dephospho-CoA kinase [Spirochaetaceae bacterium]
MKLIGLCGLSCSGKNYIAGLLKKRGIPSYDVDKAGYAALESEKEAVIARFGSEILKEDGTIDRKRLGQMVFGNSLEKKEALKALEGIVHPAANRLTEAWLAEQGQKGQKMAVVNAALLHRTVLKEPFDAIIIVRSPFLKRFFRARQRDKISGLAILSRFWNQRGFFAQYKKIKADTYIVNNTFCDSGDTSLEKQIDIILGRLN